jgi:hypothetical protein
VIGVVVGVPARQVVVAFANLVVGALLFCCVAVAEFDQCTLCPPYRPGGLVRRRGAPGLVADGVVDRDLPDIPRSRVRLVGLDQATCTGPDFRRIAAVARRLVGAGARRPSGLGVVGGPVLDAVAVRVVAVGRDETTVRLCQIMCRLSATSVVVAVSSARPSKSLSWDRALRSAIALARSASTGLLGRCGVGLVVLARLNPIGQVVVVGDGAVRVLGAVGGGVCVEPFLGGSWSVIEARLESGGAGGQFGAGARSAAARQQPAGRGRRGLGAGRARRGRRGAAAWTGLSLRPRWRSGPAGSVRVPSATSSSSHRAIRPAVASSAASANGSAGVRNDARWCSHTSCAPTWPRIGRYRPTPSWRGPSPCSPVPNKTRPGNRQVPWLQA